MDTKHKIALGLGATLLAMTGLGAAGIGPMAGMMGAGAGAGAAGGALTDAAAGQAVGELGAIGAGEAGAAGGALSSLGAGSVGAGLTGAGLGSTIGSMVVPAAKQTAIQAGTGLAMQAAQPKETVTTPMPMQQMQQPSMADLMAMFKQTGVV